MVPWIRKYQPKKTSDIQGQDSAVGRLREFISKYRSQKNKAVILYGPPGCGKTVSVYAIANEMNLEVLEINASDFRNEAHIKSIVGAASTQQSLFSKGKVILIDEIDGLSGSADRGGISALAKIVDSSGFPLVCTGNDPYDQKFSSLRKKCEMVEFHTLSYLSIFSVLKRICGEEGAEYDEDALKTLARMCGGDLRAAINDLQGLLQDSKKLTMKRLEGLSQREQKESIIEALMKIFKTTDPNIAIKAFDNVDEGFDKCLLWIDENLPKEYTKPADMARAYDFISKSDVFNRRIKRWQHWRFLVYINAFLTAGVAVSKDEKYKGFVKYAPTKRILKLWQANMKYQKRKVIAQKIAEETHSSARRVIQDTLPYLQQIFRNDRKAGEELAEGLRLGKEEVEWLRK